MFAAAQGTIEAEIISTLDELIDAGGTFRRSVRRFRQAGGVESLMRAGGFAEIATTAVGKAGDLALSQAAYDAEETDIADAWRDFLVMLRLEMRLHAAPQPE